MHTRSALPALLLVVAANVATPARGETPVDVELVIAVDVSRSMTARELEIQRRGYAEALVSEDVLKAITSGAYRQVALTYVEWAGADTQQVVVDWTLVRGRREAEAFAARLTAHFVSAMRRTSISGAIAFSAGLFDGNGFAGERRVIDVSGDGPNNQGGPVVAARDAAVASGIAINGLPLMTREGMGYQWHLDDLDEYYRHCVIGGPAAFVIPVLEWEQFPEAVRRKLVLDLVDTAPRSAPTRPVPADAEGYDCLIGEKIWQNMDWY